MTNKGWKALKKKRWHTCMHVFLFLCSVATGLPTTTKAPPPSQKWVRGKQVGGEAYIPCRARLSEKNLGASWPLRFHFWSPDKYSSRQKIEYNILKVF